MEESQRDVIQDRVGNPVILLGGLYARICNHPEQRIRNLWRMRRMAEKLAVNINIILKTEEGIL